MASRAYDLADFPVGRTVSAAVRHLLLPIGNYGDGPGRLDLLAIVLAHRLPLPVYWLAVPRRARVRYVDRMPPDKLREHYPEFKHERLVTVDYVDDGERLATLGDATQDFVIANHLLEHVENPIGAIGNWLRVLRPGGILYAAIPDKRCACDAERPVTLLDLVVRDFVAGPAGSRREHYEEWVRYVDHYSGDVAKGRADYLEQLNYSIHFHVWRPLDFLAVLVWCAEHLPQHFDFELGETNVDELVLVLRRQP